MTVVQTISQSKRVGEASSGTPSDRLTGLVERVTFHNELNGFCVLRLKVKGEQDLVTVLGHAPSVTPG